MEGGLFLGRHYTVGFGFIDNEWFKDKQWSYSTSSNEVIVYQTIMHCQWSKILSCGAVFKVITVPNSDWGWSIKTARLCQPMIYGFWFDQLLLRIIHVRVNDKWVSVLRLSQTIIENDLFYSQCWIKVTIWISHLINSKLKGTIQW